MNIKQLFHSLTAVLLLTACSSDLAPEQSPAIAMPDGGEDLVPVEFSVSSGLSLTRAASSIVSFTSGEAVKVCVKPAGASDYTGYDFTTAAAGQTGVGLNAPASGDKPYFPVGASTTVQAYAYYPSTAGDAATFSVSADQTSDAGYKASDLMHAAVRTITKGSSTGTDLQMAHLMAQLHLNVTEVGLTVSSVIVNAKRSATFTPSAGTAVVTGSASDIVAASAAGDAYICIPAQQISGVTVKVVASGSGDEASRTVTYTFTSTDGFVAGSTYSINLAVNAQQLGTTTSIADWNGTSEVTVAPSGDMTIDDIAAVTYNGSAQTPAVVVKKNGATVSSSDYDLNWVNNTNAGTAVVVATGKNTHAGSVAVGTFTINKAAGSISYASGTETKTYGNTAFTKTLSKTGDGTVTYSCSPAGVATVDENTGAVTIIGAGSTTITATVADGSNYAYASTTASYTLTVNKAALTLTADNKSRSYGASNPTLTFTASGFVNGETTSVLTTQPTLSTTAVTSSAVGTYPITISGATAANYTITHTNGTLTVSKAATTVTTAPTKADNWTADGSAHNLLASAGAASTGGTMYYYSSTTNSTPTTSASGWSTTIPSATTAGTYYVWYYAKGDSNHSDSSVGGPLTITVSSPYTMASAATSSHIGQVICNNGHIHATVSAATSAGCTASAMIAYVGSSNNAAGSGAYSSTFNHGLAVALTDVSNTSGAEGSSTMTWANAGTAAVAYTRARSTTYTSAWFLPSAYQWERILIGCGGTTSYTTSLSDGMSFSYGNFRTNLTNCGGTDVQSDAYWSSTEYRSSGAWLYYFVNSKFYYYNKADTYYVRAVLAF